MRSAYALVVVAYAQAAERLRAGDRLVKFPERNPSSGSALRSVRERPTALMWFRGAPTAA